MDTQNKAVSHWRGAEGGGSIGLRPFSGQSGLIWSDLVGFGWIWLDLVGFGWTRLDFGLIGLDTHWGIVWFARRSLIFPL